MDDPNNITPTPQGTTPLNPGPNNIFTDNTITSTSSPDITTTPNPTSTTTTPPTLDATTPFQQETIQPTPDPAPSTQQEIIQSPSAPTFTQTNPYPQPNDPAFTNAMPAQPNPAASTQPGDELLKAFIGNNYNKITTKQFNFAGFFFTSLYMFYRKMFGCALLTFLISIVISIIVNALTATASPAISIGINFATIIIIGVIVGFFVNKLYLSHARKKITSIKASNPQKSLDELKVLCSLSGNTSVGEIFLGFFVELVISTILIIPLFFAGLGVIFRHLSNPNNLDIIIDTDTPSAQNGTPLTDVTISGYSCFISNCTITLTDPNGDFVDYKISSNDKDILTALTDYKDYITLNIHYTENNDQRTITDYQIYLTSDNTDISHVQNEAELREAIGLYSLGTHTARLTLVEIGTTGFDFDDDDNSYTYQEYTFLDTNNDVEYEMQYIDDGNTLDLVEGNQYTVTFEVTEGVFHYEYTIQSITE